MARAKSIGLMNKLQKAALKINKINEETKPETTYAPIEELAKTMATDCWDDSDCKAGGDNWICFNGKCRTIKPLGSSCEGNDECYPNKCVSGQNNKTTCMAIEWKQELKVSLWKAQCDSIVDCKTKQAEFKKKYDYANSQPAATLKPSDYNLVYLKAGCKAAKEGKCVDFESYPPFAQWDKAYETWVWYQPFQDAAGKAFDWTKL